MAYETKSLRSVGAIESPWIIRLFTKIFAIASNTFVESIRQPVFAVIVGCASILIMITPHITMFALTDDHKLIVDMGFATMMLAGLFLAAFTASKVITEELENKTALTVIAKPVGRIEFILGKFLGVMAGIMVGVYLMALTLLLAVAAGTSDGNIDYEFSPFIISMAIGSILVAIGYGIYSNYFNDKPFPSRTIGAAIILFTISAAICLAFDFRAVGIERATSLIGKAQAAFSSRGSVNIQIVFGSILVFWSLLIMAAVSIAASTRLAVVVNVVVCATVFLMGLLSRYFFKDSAAMSLSTQQMWMGVLFLGTAILILVGGSVLILRYLPRHINVLACLIVLVIGSCLGAAMENWTEGLRQFIRTSPNKTQADVDRVLKQTQQPAVHILALSKRNSGMFRIAKRTPGFVYLTVILAAGAAGFCLSLILALVAYFARWRMLRGWLQMAGYLLSFLIGTFTVSYLIFFIRGYAVDMTGPKVLTAKILYNTLPDLQMFWIADILSVGRGVPPYFVIMGGLYAAFFVMACLVIAVMLFRERQLA
jgi:ABC-type transport system involved in multi-copper enzyme maturation permease subunit